MSLPFAFGINTSGLQYMSQETLSAYYPYIGSGGLGAAYARGPIDYYSQIYGQVSTAIEMIRTDTAAMAEYGIFPLRIVIIDAEESQVTTAQFQSDMGEIFAACPGTHWEIDNEPDYNSSRWPGGAAQYVSFVKAAWAAKQANDTTTKIIAPVLSNVVGSASGPEWAIGCYEAGMFGYYDIFSFHLYPWPNSQGPDDSGGNGTMASQWNDLISLRAQYNDTTPLWYTEFGWSTGYENTITQAEQASYIQDWIDEIVSGNAAGGPFAVDAVFYFEIVDINSDGGQFGLLSTDPAGSGDQPWTEKTAYSTVQALIAAPPSSTPRFVANSSGQRLRIVS